MTKIIKQKPGIGYQIVNFIFSQLVKVFFLLPIIENKTKGDKAAQQTIQLYSNTDFGGLSAKIRFWDSHLQELERKIPSKGKILDLGCGEGILTNYLGIAGIKRKIIGIELNKDRVKLAKMASNVNIIQGNVLKSRLPKVDVIVMSHMLHHLQSSADQIRLIKRCHSSLRKGGLLVVAEVDKKPSLKYILGWITDVIIVPILFEKQIYDSNIYHRGREEWRRIFEENAFKIKSLDLLPGGPFPDLIIVAQKV